MTLVYFDSSALVKLVVEEEGSELAAELWDGCDAALASRLAYPRSAPRSPPRAATTISPTRTWRQPSRPGSSTGPGYARSSSPPPWNATPGN
jgi:hypothetical protein